MHILLEALPLMLNLREHRHKVQIPFFENICSTFILHRGVEVHFASFKLMLTYEHNSLDLYGVCIKLFVGSTSIAMHSHEPKHVANPPKATCLVEKLLLVC